MEAPAARYRFFGIPFTVGEGVTWRLESADGATSQVSAQVWGTFPCGLAGRVAAGCAASRSRIRRRRVLAKPQRAGACAARSCAGPEQRR